MAYNVPTNGINGDVLYKVIGTKSVVYNSVTYNTNDTFRGIFGVSSFTYSGSGTEEVNEVTELRGFSIEFKETSVDTLQDFPDITELKGFSIEFHLNEEEKRVMETTIIRGFSIELVDYPFYIIPINLTRFPKGKYT